MERQFHAAADATAGNYEIPLNRALLNSAPISALLSQFLVAFTIEFDNEFERQMPHRTTNHGATGPGPWLVSMAMWFTCMRFLTDEGVTAGELTALVRTDTNLNGMERWGYITIDAPQTAGRAKRVALRFDDPAYCIWAAGSTGMGTVVRCYRRALAGTIWAV